MGNHHSQHVMHATNGTSKKKGEKTGKIRRRSEESRSDPFSQTVGVDYEIDSKILGRGHYGVVRKCTNKMTDEVCAVKAISKKRVSRPEVLKREIEILKSVNHPNIIQIRGVYEDAHHVFIVTELCTGGELFERIIEKTKSSEGHYSEEDAAKIIRQVLEAIYYCHEMQICHRDLKPENFLFQTSDPNALVKIIDFGLARVEDIKKGVPREMHTRVGTPYYIAPEVLARSYTKACDLWSIGVITYILLCGYPPFNGESDVAIFERVKRGLSSRNFPEEDWESISSEAKAFIRNLLDLDPSVRMTAAEALRDPWIVARTASFTVAVPHKVRAHHRNKTKLNGDQLANRLKNFVGMSKLKKVALNVLAHHLTEREISELSMIWRQIDVQGTGVITLAQLRETLEENGHDATEDEMEELLQGIDTDANDEIDYFEFAASLLARNQTIRDDRMKEVFMAIDQNHKGYIEIADFAEIMGSDDHAREVLGDTFPPDGKMSLHLFQEKLASM